MTWKDWMVRLSLIGGVIFCGFVSGLIAMCLVYLFAGR